MTSQEPTGSFRERVQHHIDGQKEAASELGVRFHRYVLFANTGGAVAALSIATAMISAGRDLGYVTWVLASFVLGAVLEGAWVLITASLAFELVRNLQDLKKLVATGEVSDGRKLSPGFRRWISELTSKGWTARCAVVVRTAAVLCFIAGSVGGIWTLGHLQVTPASP